MPFLKRIIKTIQNLTVKTTKPKKTNMSEESNTGSMSSKIMGVALALIAALVVGTIGYFLFFNQEPENAELEETTTQVQPPPSGEVSGIDTGGSLTTSTPTTPTPPPVTNQSYQNSVLGFNAQIPADWKIVKNVRDEVIFTSSDNKRYSVQKYNLPDSNMAEIRKGLERLGNIHNVTDNNLNGHPAFSFNVDGIYQQGLAMFTDGKLYYLLGPDIKTSPLSSFSLR